MNGDDDSDARLGQHWKGNCAAPAASFATDGHCMFLKEAVHAWAMPLLALSYWDVRPEAPEEACRKVFDDAVTAATVTCVLGWCRRHGEDLSDEWYLEVLRGDGVTSWLSPYKALVVIGALQPDEFRQSPDPFRAVVLCRGGRPVGIIMPVKPNRTMGERFAWPLPTADSPKGTE